MAQRGRARVGLLGRPLDRAARRRDLVGPVHVPNVNSNGRGVELTNGENRTWAASEEPSLLSGFRFLRCTEQPLLIRIPLAREPLNGELRMSLVETTTYPPWSMSE